jgi:putative addiction module component (TIGR02574 family)
VDVANDLLAQALSLPPAQRAELAQQLIDSLPEEDELPVVVDQDLAAEVDRRIENHRLGRAKTVDFETFKRTIREAAKGPPAP